MSEYPTGFPRLAAFQAADTNFSMYRGFSYLHSRLLLDLQDELALLEKELADLDWDDFEDNPQRLRSRELDVAGAVQDGNARTRRLVLADIKIKIAEYGRCAIQASPLIMHL